MQILVLIGSSVSEVGQVKVCHFPFKRYMAYNNLHSTTVHAVIVVQSALYTAYSYSHCLLRVGQTIALIKRAQKTKSV
jgi:hypothetical protein